MKKLALCVIIFVFIFNTGCVERKISTISVDTKTEDYIVYNLGTIPESLVLLEDSKIRSKDMLLALFEGLVKLDDNGEVIPGIAESWTIGKDDLTYTFKLREDAKWSSGIPVTAEDFKNFFKDILSPNQDNIYAYQLYCIFGAQEYRENKRNFDGVAIRTVDANTLEIRLNYPVNYFLKILSQPVYTLRKIDSKLKSWKDNYNSIAYSGPFQVDEVSEGGEITLVKNEYYYAIDEVASERLFITSYTGSENALAQFKTNKVNLIINPPLSESRDLILDGEAEVIPIESCSSINFNLKKTGIISNNDFRKALSLAINRENLLLSDLNFIARSATALVPNDTVEAAQGIQKEPLVKQEEDILLSKELLEKSKYNKKDKIKIVYLNNSENRRLCESIVRDIKEDLDVSFDYKGLSETEFIYVLKNSDYDLIIMNNALLYDDPFSMLEFWVSNSKFNLFSYKNSEFDSLMYKSRSEKDEVQRAKLLREAEIILLNDAPAIPLYFNNIILGKKSEVQGVHVTKEGNVRLDKAYIEDYLKNSPRL